jgi:hypothetical protein
MVLVLSKSYGVRMKSPTREPASTLFRISNLWGVPPFQPRPVDVGKGLYEQGLFKHPMNAHVGMIEVLHETQEFVALYEAVKESERTDGPLTLQCASAGRPLTETENLAVLSALHNALVQFWVLVPLDQQALPLVLHALHYPYCRLKPVGCVSVQSWGAPLLYIDGYFQNSSDRAVQAAFSYYDTLLPGEQACFPKGKFHVLVQEERAKVRSAHVGQVTSSSRFTWRPVDAPLGFESIPALLPAVLDDPRFLGPADQHHGAYVVRLFDSMSP